MISICWTEEEISNHQPVLSAKLRKGKGGQQKEG